VSNTTYAAAGDADLRQAVAVEVGDVGGPPFRRVALGADLADAPEHLRRRRPGGARLLPLPTTTISGLSPSSPSKSAIAG
jgi:hypothetical protein